MCVANSVNGKSLEHALQCLVSGLQVSTCAINSMTLKRQEHLGHISWDGSRGSDGRCSIDDGIVLTGVTGGVVGFAVIVLVDTGGMTMEVAIGIKSEPRVAVAGIKKSIVSSSVVNFLRFDCI